jgi:hypothetical protein
MEAFAMSRFLPLGLALVALAITGCQKDTANQQATTYQTSNFGKPVVAILPVIDSTKNDYAWNLSDELTSFVYSRLSQDGALSLDSPAKTRALVKKLKETQNPFSTDTSWMKQTFSQQFVIFLELIEHEEVLKQDRKKETDPALCSADLKMSMRVRVFDLRGEEPKVVLQEMINDSHFVPKQFTRTNFYQIPWGDENFNFSTLGIAHLEFTKEIASRIEDYILLATKAHLF